MNAADYVDRMTSINRKKIERLKLLREAYEREHERLLGSDVDSLAPVMAEKQRLMDEMDKLDEQFRVYSERLKQQLGIDSLERLAGSGIPGLPELKGTTGEIISILQEIDGMHREDTRLVRGEMDRTTRLIGQVKQGRAQARQFGRAYFHRPIQTSSVYFDKKK